MILELQNQIDTEVADVSKRIDKKYDRIYRVYFDSGLIKLVMARDIHDAVIHAYRLIESGPSIVKIELIN